MIIRDLNITRSSGSIGIEEVQWYTEANKHTEDENGFFPKYCLSYSQTQSISFYPDPGGFFSPFHSLSPQRPVFGLYGYMCLIYIQPRIAPSMHN